jgi:hypothetical protein
LGIKHLVLFEPGLVLVDRKSDLIDLCFESKTAWHKLVNAEEKPRNAGQAGSWQKEVVPAGERRLSE